MSNDELSKSIDLMIDELFTEEEIEKALGEPNMGEGDPKTKADEVVNKAPKGKKDSSRGEGRPVDIHDIPENDKDDKSKGYDAVQKKEGDMGKDIPEARQIDKNAKEVKKSISLEEYEEFQALRKAEDDRVMDELRKSFMIEQKDLIKSAVYEATSSIRHENEELRKSLSEQTSLVKSIASKPQTRKSITSYEALEKSERPSNEPEFFTKSQMLDVAEELFKSGKIRDTHVMELENNGYIYDNTARAALENELKKR